MNITMAPFSVVPNFFFFLLIPAVGLPPELKCRRQSTKQNMTEIPEPVFPKRG